MDRRAAALPSAVVSATATATTTVPDEGSAPSAQTGLDLTELALSRAVLDRAGDRRNDDQWWQAVLSNPRTRYLPVRADRFPIHRAEGAVRLAWSEANVADGEPSLLGVDAIGRAHVAVAIPESAGPGDPTVEWAGLREVGGDLDDLDAGAATHALALLGWHRAEPFSPASGLPTRPAQSGSVRVSEDGGQAFPRTDPAMIVLVHEGQLHDPAGRALLGHQRVWPAGRFSCLAGFVEAGESLEHAVTREVAEEAAVEVGDIHYAGSQPWPFPRSLMIGFTARASHAEIRPDGEEISELRWFTRAELLADVESGAVRLPGRISIARHLIEGWYGGELPGDW